MSSEPSFHSWFTLASGSSWKWLSSYLNLKAKIKPVICNIFDMSSFTSVSVSTATELLCTCTSKPVSKDPMLHCFLHLQITELHVLQHVSWCFLKGLLEQQIIVSKSPLQEQHYIQDFILINTCQLSNICLLLKVKNCFERTVNFDYLTINYTLKPHCEIHSSPKLAVCDSKAVMQIVQLLDRYQHPQQS